MVFALAGDSTTTSFTYFLTHTRKGGDCAIRPRQAGRKLTLPPAWRSRRPARSSSSSAICTAPLASAGQADDLVDRHRRRAEQLLDQRRARRRRSTSPAPALVRRGAASATAAVERPDRLDHVGGILDQGRAVADQLVAALRARVERRARHRHHLAPRFGRQPRGDQRARSRRRLDHHRPAAHPGDDPVAVGEMARPRLGARRHFGEHQPALVQRLLPLLVLGRVEDVDAAGDDADRAGLQRAVMRGAVDARGPGRRRRPASCWPRSCASPRAKRHAAADALRAPTIATACRSSRLRLPLAISSGGASSSSASRRG